MDKMIYCGRGDCSMYAEYMTLINNTFNFSNDENGFISLLPKLYNPEYMPCESNWVIRGEDGKLKAAVGSYDDTYYVCGEKIKCRGIGNVAVDSGSRSLGYMRKLMTGAVDEMIADGVAISALGGRRIRYSYFSYEHAGAQYNFSFADYDNAHYFGERSSRFIFREITSPDDSVLTDMIKLYESEPLHSLRRPEKRFFDVARSWRTRIFAAFESGELAGYSVGYDDITELILRNTSDIGDYICDYMQSQKLSLISVSIPFYKVNMASEMRKFSESVRTEDNESYTVLDYKKVIAAYLKLKGIQSRLPDGSSVLLIHGRAGDEQIKISVKDGVVNVTDTFDTPDHIFDHLEAMNILFGASSPEREKLEEHLRAWLPLPIFIYRADVV